ncbi:MAG: response regulator [Methylacidiphilales bacterium]|nr:response regulator [Candidatus Methylacidiphilales bacterium]
MEQTLHVLHIEDSEGDSELVRQLLVDEGIDCHLTRVETRGALFDALQNKSFDLILSDCKLPNFSGLDALEISHALKPETPFVFVSGTIGEEAAIESLRNGATDYVLKDRLSRLAPAVRRAVAEAEEHTLCRQMQHRLHEMARLEAVGTLSTGIAHNFNNILTIILGHASLLKEASGNPEQVERMADTITEAARRATDVVQQLMAFAHKSSARATWINLNRWIAENLDSFTERLPTGVNLTFAPNLGLPDFLADSSQLKHILTNLIENAVESIPQSGTITISTQLASADELPHRLPGTTHNHYVCLKVTDTGAGMDLSTREHAFEPFYTTKDRGRGTGLGLAVVYGLMQAHKGCVDVESETGAGTTVSLFFPVPKTASTHAPSTTAGSNPRLRGSETILVVEDEVDVSYFLETILQSHGYRVYCAHDYNEAMTLFQEHKNEIVLVFSDVGLPRTDGITLCTRLKALKPGLPVILASGYSPQEFKTQMDQLGNRAFLSKPYHAHEILQSVRRVLDASDVLVPA